MDIVILIQRRPSNDKSWSLGLCNFVGAKIKQIFETCKHFLKLFSLYSSVTLVVQGSAIRENVFTTLALFLVVG